MNGEWGQDPWVEGFLVFQRNNRFPGSTKGFPGELVVKNPSANAEDTGLIPGSGRSPGGGNGNLLQYSFMENPIEEPDGLQLMGSQESDTTECACVHESSKARDHEPQILNFYQGG